jgi:hypothetical protein
MSQKNQISFNLLQESGKKLRVVQLLKREKRKINST